MTETIVRIVLDGSPQRWCGDQAISPNFDLASKMLEQAVDDLGWPASRVLFAVAPGGFIQERMPRGYDDRGDRGWASRPGDFRSLALVAEKAVWKVINRGIRTKLRRRSRFLTVGVDLVPEYQSKTTGGTGTRAELVAVVDLDEGAIVRWTGKSYPRSGQEERVLVQEPCLESHLLCAAGHRVLLLGCHDLNMFNGRGRFHAKNERQRRWQDMDNLARRFNPTMVLHHPHQTDLPDTWRQGWSGLRRLLGFDGQYASGIAYFPRVSHSWRARYPLDDVLKATKSDDVIDICVKGYWRGEWERC